MIATFYKEVAMEVRDHISLEGLECLERREKDARAVSF